MSERREVVWQLFLDILYVCVCVYDLERDQSDFAPLQEAEIAQNGQGYEETNLSSV